MLAAHPGMRQHGKTACQLLLSLLRLQLVQRLRVAHPLQQNLHAHAASFQKARKQLLRHIKATLLASLGRRRYAGNKVKLLQPAHFGRRQSKLRFLTQQRQPACLTVKFYFMQRILKHAIIFIEQQRTVQNISRQRCCLSRQIFLTRTAGQLTLQQIFFAALLTDIAVVNISRTHSAATGKNKLLRYTPVISKIS